MEIFYFLGPTMKTRAAGSVELKRERERERMKTIARIQKKKGQYFISSTSYFYNFKNAGVFFKARKFLISILILMESRMAAASSNEDSCFFDDIASRLRSRRVLGGTAADAINECGWCVVDDFMDERSARELYERVKAFGASSQSHFQQHVFQFGQQRFSKPGIYEMDLHDASARKHAPVLRDVFRILGPELAKAAAEALPALGLASDDQPAIKLQMNRGGAFPMHYDNPGPPNLRGITCVVYLNPEWEESEGGQIELLPFLGRRVVVAPTMNRAVFFRSDRILHSVAPWQGAADRPRFCFSVWINAREMPESKLTRDHLRFTSYDQAASFFASSPLQRVISRAIYAEEYEASLRRCMQSTPGEDVMLAQHHATIAALARQLKPLIDNLKVRKSIEDPLRIL